MEKLPFFTITTAKLIFAKKKKKNFFDGVIKIYLQISRKHNFQNKEVILS